MSRHPAYNRMIHSQRWRRLRLWKLSRQPLCEDCLREGRTAAASEVHHVVPVETAHRPADMERLMFSPANLRSLCHDCHAATHRQLGSHTKGHTREANERRTRHFVARWLGDAPAGTGANETNNPSN